MAIIPYPRIFPMANRFCGTMSSSRISGSFSGCARYSLMPLLCPAPTIATTFPRFLRSRRFFAMIASRSPISTPAVVGENALSSATSWSTTPSSVTVSISISVPPSPSSPPTSAPSIFIFSKNPIFARNRWSVIWMSLSTSAISVPSSSAASIAAIISEPGFTSISDPILFWMYARKA